MEKDQAEDMLVTIEATYPMFMNGRPEVLKKRIEVWLYRLMDMDYIKTKKNLDEYINTNEYPPTIADIKPFEFQFDSAKEKIERMNNNEN